jgi:hypothetical protein
MSDLAGPFIRAIVGIVDFVTGVVGLLLWSERRLSTESRVGDSRVDRAVRRTYEQILDWWQWIGLGLLLTGVIFGCYLLL